MFIINNVKLHVIYEKTINNVKITLKKVSWLTKAYIATISPFSMALMMAFSTRGLLYTDTSHATVAHNFKSQFFQVVNNSTIFLDSE